MAVINPVTQLNSGHLLVDSAAITTIHKAPFMMAWYTRSFRSHDYDAHEPRSNVLKTRKSDEHHEQNVGKGWFEALKLDDYIVAHTLDEYMVRQVWPSLTEGSHRVKRLDELHKHLYLTNKYLETILRRSLTARPGKSYGGLFASGTLATTPGEEDTARQVVVRVGLVRIEIEDGDGQKTTNIHITWPKTVVTSVADKKYIGNPRWVQPASTIH